MSPTATVPVILCRADEYHSAGEVFGEIVTDAVSVHEGLIGVLSANAGMAGSDSVGGKWAASYDEAAGLAMSTSARLTTASGQTRDLISVGLHNLQAGESAANFNSVPPPAAPQMPPVPCLVETPASAAGDGIPEPFGWSIIKDLVGAAWPNGHQDELHTAEAAWNTAASDFRTLAMGIPEAVGFLSNQQSDEIPAAIDACTQRQNDLHSLADACQSLGQACDEYAHHLDEAHHQILDELKEFAAEAIVGELAFAALAPFTAGISEWVGNTALGARVAMKARRVAAIIASLATKAAEITSRAVKPLVESLKPLLERISTWVDAARTKLTEFLGRSNPKSGLSQKTIDDILGTPKGARPDPSSYLSPEYIEQHLALFDKDGATRFMVESNLNRYGIGQADGTSFVMPRGEADALLATTKGDPAALEKALGLPDGFLESNKLVRVDIPHPDTHGLRIPSGNEAGANSQWVPGGKLPDGANEAIIDVKGMNVGTDYQVTDLPKGGAK
ncbi:hypothetical protein [Nocardia sp. NBC_01388]|uniref:WXG100-like domain-containing protein n=1 Tax=Nocardia sp. NBC_01388 TaxID=2903596 RepID=UPI00324668C3